MYSQEDQISINVSGVFLKGICLGRMGSNEKGLHQEGTEIEHIYLSPITFPLLKNNPSKFTNFYFASDICQIIVEKRSSSRTLKKVLCNCGGFLMC